MSASRPIAIVAGALAAKAGNGGHAWTRASLVLGLSKLGFDVAFVEQFARASTEQREHFERVCTRFGIDGYLLSGQLPYELQARAEAAKLLLNVGGNLTFKEMKRGPRVRVYLDDDPGYTQLWLQAGLIKDRLAGHDFYFTYGANVGRPECSLPTGGIEWRPMRPPVVLDHWPRTIEPCDGFRTVATWRGAYGPVEVDGKVYGQKAHEFRRFAQVPQLAGHSFEIALDIDAADEGDAEMLRGNGWRLADPAAVAGSPDDFRSYVQGSGAEFSVAQGVYVDTRCGWFSDRTTRFLASAKPAVVQDTGFSRDVRTGQGLIAFSSVEEAVAGTNAIQHDYEAHAECARAIAEEHFDSDKVLGRMLEEVGL